MISESIEVSVPGICISSVQLLIIVAHSMYMSHFKTIQLSDDFIYVVFMITILVIPYSIMKKINSASCKLAIVYRIILLSILAICTQMIAQIEYQKHITIIACVLIIGLAFDSFMFHSYKKEEKTHIELMKTPNYIRYV